MKVARGSKGSKKPHAQQSHVRLELGSTRLPHSQQHVNFSAPLLSGVRKKANKNMQQGKGAQEELGPGAVRVEAKCAVRGWQDHAAHSPL
jgi:hypothetical protein